jgi:hypothetical protein
LTSTRTSSTSTKDHPKATGPDHRLVHAEQGAWTRWSAGREPPTGQAPRGGRAPQPGEQLPGTERTLRTSECRRDRAPSARSRHVRPLRCPLIRPDERSWRRSTACPAATGLSAGPDGAA